jgi:hypothetical protein
VTGKWPGITRAPLDAIPKTRWNFGLRLLLRLGPQDPGKFLQEIIKLLPTGLALAKANSSGEE